MVEIDQMDQISKMGGNNCNNGDYSKNMHDSDYVHYGDMVIMKNLPLPSTAPRLQCGGTWAITSSCT